MRLYEDQAGNSYDNMSDDDRDIDIDSDDGEDSDNTKSQPRNSSGGQFYSQAEKRAHHNALERKRRDHIKDSFTSLRDSVPSLQGEKVSKRSEKASRAQILKKAAEYIQFMRRKNNSHQQDIDDLKRQNSLLETQIRSLEQARATGNFGEGSDLGLGMNDSSRESDSSDIDDGGSNNGSIHRSKKMKTNSNY
ncbi:protein max isoform X1 [Culex quinquefasciatus]|uniref:Protein max n=1 Tax=Culex pipiens TaxID=7175 RepID=A0A8D8HTL4_CULPI|nr:protein max isoform X1 [Culex quinquefasciatus]XP_039452447.1 protein max isoform X1 [Culex pipiens pallens]